LITPDLLGVQLCDTENQYGSNVIYIYTLKSFKKKCVSVYIIAAGRGSLLGSGVGRNPTATER